MEEKLKADKLLTATKLKQTRPKHIPTTRKPLGLTASQSTTGIGSSQPEPAQPELSLTDLTQISQAVQFRSGGDSLKTLAMTEDTLSKLPMAVQPEALKSQLLPYQLQGLAWLQSKEDPKFPEPGSEEATQLWKRDAKGRYFNAASCFTATSAPELAKGGILADDMGLGKTLQMISLILTGGSGATLIVYAPLLLKNIPLLTLPLPTGGSR